jgi:tyrosyl-tRNA synthetase
MNARRGFHLPALLSEQLDVSRSEARRIINQGGVKLDGEAVVELDPPAERIAGKTLKVGKSREVQVP